MALLTIRCPQNEVKLTAVISQTHTKHLSDYDHM
jgi:hypothetical protein